MVGAYLPEASVRDHAGVSVQTSDPVKGGVAVSAPFTPGRVVCVPGSPRAVSWCVASISKGPGPQQVLLAFCLLMPPLSQSPG